MKRLLIAVAGIILFPLSTAGGESGTQPLMFHESFDSAGFLENDVINRSGHVSQEERGLTLGEGRFGSGIKLNLAPDMPEPGSDGMHNFLLDTVTRLVVHIERMHGSSNLFTGPIYWGTGRLNPSSGSVAFWVKGPLSEGDLFCQSAMDWGRKEQYLLAVTVDGNGRIGAYIDDARYERHTIQSDQRWDSGRWNHVVLNFDRANGLELFVNGESAASSWGQYSWWETQPPGLMYLSMPHVAYDEWYIFSRPLEKNEIRSLLERNSPPGPDAGIPLRTEQERGRLAQAVGLSAGNRLPVIKPLQKNRVLSWKEITPARFGDGCIPARFCNDGAYELAWPHNIAAFTWVPGDADFQAEKLEVEAPPHSPWNYISIEGNLDGMPRVLSDAEKEEDHYSGETFLDVPQDSRFFFGAEVGRKAHPMITLPFLKGYGAPEEYTGDVRLPITGKTRIHEVGIFDVVEKADKTIPGEETYYLCAEGALSDRYAYAMKAVQSLADRKTLYGNSQMFGKQAVWMEAGAMARTNLVTAPATGKKCIGAVLLDLTIKTRGEKDILLVRLHDPCLPHRIWTHAELNLSGFDSDGGRVRLLLDAPPLYLEKGDVVWLDIMTMNNASIQAGGDDGSVLVLKPAPFLESEKSYEMKAIRPAMAEYSKGYEYSPWLFENVWPDVENPEVFGGRYDILLSSLAVKRVLPWSRLADYYIEWSKPKHKWGYFWNLRQQMYFHGSDAPMTDYFPIRELPVPDSVPRWAYLQHEIQNLRYRFIDWLAVNQNPDGQFGGGWNDDILIMRNRHDIPLDGCGIARDIFLKVNEGFDNTLQFGGGYCRILPIDSGHVHDFVRYRYNALLFKPGDPFVWRRAMETAWHWDKPEQTPLNYRNGAAFLPEKNMLEWLWGIRKTEKPFESVRADSLMEEMARLVSYIDDNLFYRISEARVHTDHYWFEEERLVTQMILGGEPDQGVDLSVSWPKGGGKDIARWVSYADDTSLACRIFSFRSVTNELTGRLYRIGSGEYEISLYEDKNGRQGALIDSQKLQMKRFDTFTVGIPPGKPVILSIKRLKKGTVPDRLPDLAVAGYDCERRGTQLRVRVTNLGSADSGKAVLALYDSAGSKISQADIPPIAAPLDFVDRHVCIDFENVPEGGDLRLVIETADNAPDLFYDNNTVLLPLSGK